ncbi:MAG: hypothetical protein ABI658_24815 [Acidimicrobiales bacterium]
MTARGVGKNGKGRTVARRKPVTKRSRSPFPKPFKVKNDKGTFRNDVDGNFVWRNIVTVDGQPVSKNGNYDEVMK